MLLSEEYGKEHGAAFLAFDRVDLDNRQFGMLTAELFKVLVGPSDAALLVNFEF